ncbi:HD domain-containing protein [Larsenimonas rhizosphaerae]|uniref:HD domain-containing protein n=1 Tax=Larsenimonas rhizosphaerae TaxID=2944682 RepID=A0AA41ZEM8_9GAMM|nr:HD domain-containing protein [Larsenimonas rhizosphaerae]MCX2523201.1 HD domain-containing protein [Larsenimonas rhizosphaerae]
MSELLLRARCFATAAHAAIDQRRKYTGVSYIEHPAAVAAMVAEHGGSDVMIAAAWLHDVVEDTAITLALLRQEFGTEVAALVEWLSDLQTPEDGNRAVRKAREAKRLSGAPAEAQTIKYADLIHNTASIVRHDPGFARVYLREKRHVLAGMTSGHPVLYQKALDSLQAGEQQLSLTPRQAGTASQ